MSIAARFSGLSLRAARIEHGLRAIDVAPYLAVRTAEGCRRLERLTDVPASTRDRYIRALGAALSARAEWPTTPTTQRSAQVRRTR
jgi:acyl-CoA reductase-like NAD-dependent aldehyde dehydrogenase